MKEQFKSKCVLRNLNPRQPTTVVATNKIAVMARSNRPMTRTRNKILGMSIEDPTSSKDPVPKRPRGRPYKRQHRENDSFPQRSETTTPAPAKKRGNPNWTKKTDKGPQNPTHQRTWEEDTPLTKSIGPAKNRKTKQQEESQHDSRNLQHDKNKNPGKQARASSTNIPNQTLDNLIQLVEKQNEHIAQQNMLLLDQISQMSDIRKLLIGFKGFFDQATEVNIRYNRVTPADTAHGTNQPYAGPSMEQPPNNANHGIDPGLYENRFNQSFNWNVSGCFMLTSCNRSTPSQNSYAYGIMLIAALTTLLLIIYNCSYQVLATRNRTLAKSREAAAQNAKETATTSQRWKLAEEAAKNFSSGLQAHLSPKFPRKMDVPGAPLHPSAFSASLFSNVPSKGNKKESLELRQMHEIEDNPEDSFERFIFGPEDTIIGSVPRGKLKRSHSQIFKYAYAEIEREKSQQQVYMDLTLPGEVNVTIDNGILKRPLIEVSFKDLTVTLKAQNKHLLRCVTGKLKPGHITAVMGPSGAGKTTFLSALAGKAIGCTMTGLVLINGKNEPIHSYKKIIGFAPQDDIVHGNLTVEENLWFSAKCRLSADSSKADKFLITERVIESLGLQTIRDSLVGTVEKRGISGGQRKRVNVGLEMVMEPSLLILDEPTSGLDSASSQLLLRALRREALEGVNICMVVHQPSYALFKMFDDLVLLAKGGLTVYHGSAQEVEEYFSGMGINVPDRINPPDYFIDILEGVVTTNISLNVNYKDLPIRWMLHNEYLVPPDMWQGAAGLALSSTCENSIVERNIAGARQQEASFVRNLWKYVKSTVEFPRDSVRFNFLKSKDLSYRRTPGVLQQYKYFLFRVGKQRLREARVQAVDYLILLIAGVCLGSLAKVGDQTFGALGYTHTIIVVSLLCKIAALRSFSLERLHYWREAASGMSSLAYFLAKDTIDHFNTVIKPLVYLSMFYFFTNPRSSLADNYIVLVCLVYCVTGIAYILAISFDQGAAQLLSVLLPVVLTLTATRPQDSKLLKMLANLCYPKWALEAFVLANAERYYGVWLITRCGLLKQSGYDLHDWNLCLIILIVTGLVSRVTAFCLMLIFQKR